MFKSSINSIHLNSVNCNFILITSITLLFSVYIKVDVFNIYNPLAIGGDLALIKELTDGKSNVRINQYILGSLYDFLSHYFDTDFANAAQLVSLFSSIFTPIVLSIIIYQITLNKISFYASIILYSCSEHFNFVLLKSESDSPFLLSILVSISLSLMLNKKLNSFTSFPFYLFIFCVFMWVISFSIRQNTILHVISLFLIYVFYLIFRKVRSRKNILNTKFISFALVFTISFILFTIGKYIYSSIVLPNYVGKETNYLKLVVYESLLVEPFQWNQGSLEDRLIARRSLKAIQNPYSDFHPDYYNKNQSFLEVLYENKFKFFTNYIKGLKGTVERLIFYNNVNLFGFIPCIIGLFIVVSKKNYQCLFFVISWLFTYLLLLPTLISHDRVVWPAGLGLSIGMPILIGELIINYLNLKSKFYNIISVFLLLVISCYSALLLRNLYNSFWYLGTDTRPNVANLIDSDSYNSDKIVMSFDHSIICHGNELKKFLPFPYEYDKETLYNYLIENKPNYIFSQIDLSTRWKKPLSALNTAMIDLKGGSSAFYYEKIYQNRNTLWRRRIKD